MKRNDVHRPESRSNADDSRPLAGDENYIFLSDDKPIENTQRKIPVAVVAVAVLTAIAAVAALVIIFTQRGVTPAPTPATTAASAAATQASSEASVPPTASAAPTTAPPVTTAPPASAAAATQAQSDEDKLLAYANSSGLMDVLRGETDSNTSVSVTAEGNILIARYTVQVDSQDGEQMEYLAALTDRFDTLSMQLDRTVYEMNTASGVANAVLELVAVDQNNVELYANLID